MNYDEYAQVIKKIAYTLQNEDRCDEAGIETLALIEAADKFEELLTWSKDAFALFEEFNIEFPTNSYRVGKLSRQMLKQANELTVVIERD
jgi:hypothetical protein